jgi:ankyrin repeat protein
MDGEIIKIITCPITLEIFNEPVILSDGHTYEKSAIINYLKNNKVSPITRKPLNDNFNNLQTNYSIKNLVNQCIANNLIKREQIYNDVMIVNNHKYDDDNFVFEINRNYFFQNGKNNEIVKKIIDKVDDLEKVCNHGSKLIHYICEHSTPDMIKYIIDKGVDLECVDKYGWKPIHFICRYSTSEMIIYIIDKGVDLECVTIDNWKPIKILENRGLMETKKYLKKKITEKSISKKIFYFFV